jgi:hypothetical protein
VLISKECGLISKNKGQQSGSAHVYWPQPVCGPGQLCVAASRAGHPGNSTFSF